MNIYRNPVNQYSMSFLQQEKKYIRIIKENLQLLAYQIWQRARSASWPAPEQYTGRPDLWNPLCLQRGCLGKKEKKNESVIKFVADICVRSGVEVQGWGDMWNRGVPVLQEQGDEHPQYHLCYSLYCTQSPEGHDLFPYSLERARKPHNPLFLPTLCPETA